MHHIHRTMGLVGAALLLATAAQAQGKGHGKDHDKAKDQRHVETSNGVVIPRGDDRGVYRNDGGTRGVYRTDGNTRGVYRNDRDDRGVYRDDRDYRNNGHVPPGLAKKPGQMPPGQYKKIYGANQGASVLGDVMRRRGYSVIRTVPSGSSQYVYYRMPDGTTRRAIVSPGTDRLRFSNIPTTLLQEVLSRLY